MLQENTKRVLVDGKAIANRMLDSVAMRIKEGRITPAVVVVTCAPNFETKKYLQLKQTTATRLGITLVTRELDDEITTDDLISVIQTMSSQYSGIVVQLPLPAHIDTERVLAAIPRDMDVDAFSYQGETDAVVLPPVVAAVATIVEQYHVSFAGKNVVVVGAGRLVGKPAALYVKSQGAQVTVIDKETPVSKREAVCAEADIIILGAGVPKLLTKEMVKEGVVVFDAGASEDGGLLVGDADPTVTDKASLFTPVPGGIGPITIAFLFHNALILAEKRK